MEDKGLKLESNITLGELYDLYLKESFDKSKNLPSIAKHVPELTIYGACCYEAHFNEFGRIDFGGWNHSLHKHGDQEIVKLIEPYLKEVYCRSKSYYIGYELIKLGIRRFKKWNYQLLTKLEEEERVIITPYTLQIYQDIKKCEEENSKKTRLIMNTIQRKVIFIGLSIIAAMLLWPPWKVGNSGMSIGYHLFFRSNPAGYARAYLDWSRLGLQGLIVAVLIAAIIIFVGNKDEARR